MDQFLIGLLFYFILLRHAPAVSLLIIDGMFVNAENVRRPRTSTRRRFGSHLDFLHHLHETWKSQRPQKIPLRKGNFGVSFDVLSVQTGHEIDISQMCMCVQSITNLKCLRSLRLVILRHIRGTTEFTDH